ncbi:hypothetical protein JAAARDRAFT_200207 [Jaapia argillacea MUCL 33604]|uniref:Transmembrane protein n=1 Tax=Jaapia argillacea MUCL 33604 TaxID=933084 RepID=A0A067PIA8_9AGAM|nr:hypothetical protein JAAARDRAFT_200207 [Jaapia argillacea MUCL 33604]
MAYILSYSLVLAQQNNTFSWGYTLDSNPGLQTCQNYSLKIGPAASSKSGSSTPPYYLIAYEVGGITTVTPVGSTSLVWQVIHAPGTQLMIAMADAKGNSGGVDPLIRTVIPSPGSISATCHIPAPDKSFVMTSNITANGNLTTCKPWGLSINGGTPPYGVTVAGSNASVVTNMTVPSGDDVVIYINKQKPNTAVHDSTGRWGIGTSLVYTGGTSKTTCAGQKTSYTSAPPVNASSSSTSSQSTSNSFSTPTSNKDKVIIMGLCVAVVAILGVAIVVLWILLSKWRGAKKDLSERPSKEELQQSSVSPPEVSTPSPPYETPNPVAVTAATISNPMMQTVDDTCSRPGMGYPVIFPHAAHPSHNVHPIASNVSNNPLVSSNPSWFAQSQQQEPGAGFPYVLPPQQPHFPQPFQEGSYRGTH